MRAGLIVASYEYGDPGLRALRAPARDAEALAGVLGDPVIGDFEVRTLLNEPAYVISEAVEGFFADRKPDDLLLLHFSCHGVKDEGGELYFAATNTKLRLLGATAVPAEFVNRCMNRSRSRRVVLLLDCCYAGAFERGMAARADKGVAIEQRFGGRGRAVITASSAMEYAFEGSELADSHEAQPSVFTAALVEGLKTGDADRDEDGQVGLDELYDYVYDRVRETTPNQTPGKWVFGVQGELYIARRSRPVTTPAPLPAAVQDAIDHPLPGVRAVAVPELARLLRGRHAGLALAARLTLERLTQDDSRTVSAAAAAVLGGGVRPVEPVESVPVESVPVESVPVESVPVESVPVEPVPPKPVPPEPTPPEPTPPRQMPSEAPPVGVTGQPRPTTAFDLRFAAGALAIAAAALLLAGLFPNYLADPTRLADYPYVLWSSVITIALAAGAGAAVLAPPTRRLVGPGILLGAASAATWGLLTYLVVVVNILHGPVGPGLWIELLGETLLLFAGFLAGLALARGTDIRPGRLDGPIPLLVGLFGLAGAVAFLVYVGQSLAADTSYPLVVPGVWGAVLAFFVPAASVVLMPRRFGAALLGGWVAGASAIVVFDGLIPSGAPALAIVVAGAALLALLVAVIPLARQSRTP